MRTLAERGVNWGELLAAAAEHGVAPCVCRRLDDVVRSAIPHLWRDCFRDAFRCNVHRNLFLTSELFRVLSALTARGVRATPYKGPVLAAQAHGDIALRQFADLDLMVPHCEIFEAHRALTGRGYASELDEKEIRRSVSAGGPVPGQYAYYSEARSVYVEIHSEATLRYFPRRLDVEAFLGRRQTILLAGGKAQTFCAEDLIILLSVHGSKHFWNRLGWIADIAALVETPGGFDWESVIRRARSLGVERMVFLAADLSRVVLGAPLPETVLSHLDRDPVVRQLSGQVCRRLFALRRPELGVLKRFSFRVRVRGRTGDGLRYAIRLATVSTESDRKENPVGKHFGSLYAVLRPLRLARLYGWRTR
ncbi:MAG: nucleotidyltransferase family protein [Candidatus Acidiferrales bacterium]